MSSGKGGWFKQVLGKLNAQPVQSGGWSSPPAGTGKHDRVDETTSGNMPSSGGAASSVLQPGEIIADVYEVKSLLGQGGMGQVWLVHHRGWNTDLALKVPRPDLLGSQRAIDDFTREAETWVNLGLHPHTVSCYYVRNLSGIPWVFAEYVDGGSLSEWIRSGKLYEGGSEKALERILDVAIQFAWGLQYAHEKGLVHQDVKPANVMMTSDGLVKVTDFGLSRARAAAGELIDTSGGNILVSTGGMTPAYCSPEQARGEKLTNATDIWSWAVSVLEMFVGEVTWMSGALARQSLESLLATDSGRSDIPVMPTRLADLLRDCFEEDPSSRQGDFSGIVKNLCIAYREAAGSDLTRELPSAAELMADALNNKAVSLHDLGRTVEAEKFWEQALESDPCHLEAIYNLGMLRWQRCEIDDLRLLTSLSEASAGTADYERAAQLIAQAHLQRDDCQSAIGVLEKSVHDGVRSEDTLRLLRAARDRLGQSRRCLRTLNNDKGYGRLVCFGPDCTSVIASDSSNAITLWDIETGQRLQTLERQEDRNQSVQSFCFSTNGRYALSLDGQLLSSDRIRLWDIKIGSCIRTLSAVNHSALVSGSLEKYRAMCISPDGKHVLGGGGDYTLLLWDSESGNLVWRNKDLASGHTVYSVCFSPGGEHALSGGTDKKLRLWDIKTGKCLRSLEAHADFVTSVCFSPDGRHALSGSRDETLRLWDIETGKCLRTLEAHSGVVTSVCFSPDGRHALSGSSDKTLRIWDVTTGKCLRTFEGHTEEVHLVRFSLNGQLALSLSGDQTMKSWTTRESADLTTYCLEMARPTASWEAAERRRAYTALMAEAAKSRDQGDFAAALRELRAARALSGCQRRADAIAAWAELYQRFPRAAFREGWCVSILAGHASPVTSVCFSPDGERALSGSSDKTLRIWDVETGKCLRTLGTSAGYPHSCCFSPDGERALYGGAIGWAELLDGGTGTRVQAFYGVGYRLAVPSACFSPDGRYVLIGGSGGDGGYLLLDLLDAKTGGRVRGFKGHTGAIKTVCFSPDGSLALSDDSEVPVLRLWDLATGHCIRIFEGHARSITSVRFSPDGKRALSGGHDDTIRLWEVTTGQCLQILETNVTSVCFSPDTRYVLSGCEDGSLRLWDLSAGQCIRIFEGHTKSVTSICLSPDGRYFLSGSKDNTLRLWFLDWELEARDTADWDECARPYLDTFMTLHTPYAIELPAGRTPTEEEITLALTRRGMARWTEDDFQGLLLDLGCAGYGWLKPGGVKNQLEMMARERTSD